MHRAITVVAISMMGCGRISFERPGDAADAPPVVPPVPPSICNVDRIDIGPTSKVVDLATAPTTAGYAAVWTDNGNVSGITLGPLVANRHLETARGTISTLRATQVTGLAAVNQYLLIASSDGTDETVLVIDSTFPPMPSQTLVLPGHVAGHDPFPSEDAQSTQAFLTAAGDTFELRRVDGIDGTIGQAITGTYSTGGATITQFSCDDGPDHGHCTWVEAAAGKTPECMASDAFYEIPSPIKFISTVSECDPVDAETRVATAPMDTVMAVVTTPSQALEAHWLRSPNDVVTTISADGSAPRLRFDGKDVFWIAWLDGQSVLQLASLDVSVLPPKLVAHPLPGWSPSTPAAFELVRRRDAAGVVVELGLVLISEGSRYLDFLTICR